MQWLWCCGNFGMLGQKYHYYFLILAVQLLTYIASYFPVHKQLISHEFTAFPWSCDHVKVMWPQKSANIWLLFHPLNPITPTWASIAVLCMPHNWGDLVQVSWVCQSTPSSDPPLIHLLCWESFVFLLSMTVKVRASCTSSTLFSLICLVVLQSSNWCGNDSCLGLLQHDSVVCCFPFC